MSTNGPHQALTVAVWRGRYGLPFAICLCGWRAKPRLLIRGAIADARGHTAATNHIPSQPIDMWKSSRRSWRKRLPRGV